ncbi:TetR/AcrR family transcriptional regulator [Mycolicibacterium neoaurum]|uniref:TetR family transcriptional regulator n=1 Tax=Mycolicibacterium neoaurum TaxID=1795 RepID=A0AAV2WRI7_MYCNE|nr:TetR/AcrR family transcriptional regulator [Mycolicibacterium neoaurum]TLH59029.1 TetR/AcrR family transcriptional regulator [Mycolicibacterium neoaurum]CDQ46909.1 TetR family transcriptional regulator [Mycolicibacterium neoaurum]SDC97749.1 transcriptional repressor [Mycolicibacterium neoaurum]
MPYVEASIRSKQFVAAARAVMSRQGVAATALRAVAAEAEVPLGTLQYVFPSKELLLRAVIEDVIEQISTVLTASVDVDRGLAHAIRQGLTVFWSELVIGQVDSQLMQFELVNYALRQPGLEHLAQWEYQRYAEAIAQWCQSAATNAGEDSAVGCDQLARLILAGVDGLTMQYACDPDDERAQADLAVLADMVIAAAGV